MEEHFFFIHRDEIKSDHFSLSESESAHFTRSLRGKPDDIIWLLDGQGMAYEGKVTSSQDIVSGSILQSISNYGESAYAIHLVIGLIKGNRMDMVIEKATELGVKSIHPILADRSVKNKLNMERAQRIVISACKQAGRSIFPKIHDPKPFNAWLEFYENDKKILCHMMCEQTIASALGDEKTEVYVIIGPEGDFSDAERNAMNHAKVDYAILGPRRLRSESAAMAAIANLNQLMGG